MRTVDEVSATREEVRDVEDEERSGQADWVGSDISKAKPEEVELSCQAGRADCSVERRLVVPL